MGTEIEYKFLVKNIPTMLLQELVEEIKQGYLTPAGQGNAIRVRISNTFNSEFESVYQQTKLTIKNGLGVSRHEFEYHITKEDGEPLMEMCEGRIVHKHRHRIPHENYVIELDIFYGKLEGLVVAEIEVPSEDFVLTNLPDWIGEDVTTDFRYTNAHLSEHGLPK